MTQSEFQKWVDEHYMDVLNSAGMLRTAMETTVVRLLEKPDVLATIDPARIVPWLVSRARGEQANERKIERARAASNHRFGLTFAVLGEDAYLDDTATNKARRKRRRTVKARKGAPSLPSDMRAVQVQWDGPMPGSVRWHFQTLRDNKLFDLRAVESLRDSIRRAAARYRHFGEQGYSFTQFGEEVLREASAPAVAEWKEEMAKPNETLAEIGVGLSRAFTYRQDIAKYEQSKYSNSAHTSDEIPSHRGGRR